MLNSGDLTISGTISGEGNLLKSQQAAGTTLILSGSNTYTGGSTINAGNVSISSIKNLDSMTPSSLGIPTNGNGTIGMGTASRLIYTGTGDSSDRDFELQGSPLRFTQSGSGHLKYSGDLTVNISGVKALTLDGSSDGTGELAGNIFNPPETGNTRIIKDGSGTWMLSGTNEYLGTTIINAGTLIVGSDSPNGSAGALGGASSAVNLGALVGTNDTAILIGGAFTLARDVTILTNSIGVATLGGHTAQTSTFSGSIDLQKSARLTSAEYGTVIFSGSISNTGGVTKRGAGRIVLSGTNTYNGTTAIHEGTLSFIDSGSIADSPELEVAAGATLDVSGLSSVFEVHSNQALRGAGTITGSMNVAGIIDPGSITTSATLTALGNVSFASGARLIVDVSALTNDVLFSSGNVVLSSASLTINGTLTKDSYVILSANGTLSGIFNGLTNNAAVPSTGYRINYVTGSSPEHVVLNKIASPIQYVIHISIDGLHADAPKTLIASGMGTNFHRLYVEGSSTDDARTDYSSTVTSPNHATMLTGRPVVDWPGKPGHLWGNNDTHPWDRWALTIHMPHTVGQFYGPGPGEVFSYTNSQYYADSGPNKTNYAYVSSVFDVVSDSGKRTGTAYSKDRILVIQRSYVFTHGRLAPNLGVIDPAVNKVNFGQYSSTFGVISNWMPEMVANPFHYSFLHFSLPDDRGHSYSWSFTNRWRADLGMFENSWNTNQNRYFPASYMGAIQQIDIYLGEIFSLIETNEELNGRTAIVITTDHGGKLGEFDHGFVDDSGCYRINVFAWGPGIPAGGDLYTLNPHYTKPAITNRPDYNIAQQPIRNGDTANLALSLLGLGSIPGSTMNSDQMLNVLNKITPNVTTPPSASNIFFGQPLADSLLSGGSASVPGVFTFTAPSMIPEAGTADHSVTFIPEDTNNYVAVIVGVSVTVEELPTTFIGTMLMNGSNTLMNWPGTSSWFYTIESTTELFPGTSWSNLTGYSDVPGTNGIMSIMGDVDSETNRYFRVKLSPHI